MDRWAGAKSGIVDVAVIRPAATSRKRFTAMGDDPVAVAKRLLGQRLVRVLDGKRLAGTIVEVEAYLGAKDRAAHTWNGRRTPRVESMYLPGGHAYVYFTYGNHHCLNVVCGHRDEGVAVLIRAIEPTEGIELMFAHRRAARSGRIADLCSGPGKLTQALLIDRRLDGVDLRTCAELFIEKVLSRPLLSSRIARSARIGLNPTPRNGPTWPGDWATRPLRFGIAGSAFISRAFT
jgi:DNA-3-methyladenine glycosylase